MKADKHGGNVMQKHTLEEAEQILLNVSINKLVPPLYVTWEDEQGRVCPIRCLADRWNMSDYEVLPALGIQGDLDAVARAYDNSPGRRKGVLRVISWLREHGARHG